MELAGRRALVTGAAIGTGRAIALALAAEGAKVVVSDIEEAGGRETAERCGAGFVPADLMADDEVRRLVETAEPTLLVNNAGGGGHIPPHFPDASPAEWGATLDLNLRVAMLATQLALPGMRRAGSGAIVNVASTAGIGPDPAASPEYAAAKAGLIRFTAALASVDGVRVNCIVPDWIATERLTEEERASDPPPIPLETISGAVIRLLRDDSLAGRALAIWRGGLSGWADDGP